MAFPNGGQTLIWIGLGLLALAGLVYFVAKWLQQRRRREPESPLPLRPQPLAGRPDQITGRPQPPVPAPATLPSQTPPPMPQRDESDSEARWATLPVILLGIVLITAIITVLLLFFLDYQPFLGLELDLPGFGGDAFRTYEHQPLPIPVLQEAPAEDLAELMAVETERLNSYGWVNEEAGIAHIPIDRAMGLLIERGLSAPKTAP
ncbi:MAG TPA: hypothetical protein VF177_19405 [Anaerolineae bacterium]